MGDDIPSFTVEEVCAFKTYVEEGLKEIELLTEKCDTLKERLTQQEEKYKEAIRDLDFARKDNEQRMNGLDELQSKCRDLTQQNYQKHLEVKIAEETRKRAEDSLRSATATSAVLTRQNREMLVQEKKMCANMIAFLEDRTASEQELNNICIMAEVNEEPCCQGVQQLLLVKKDLIDQALVYKSRIAHLAPLLAEATEKYTKLKGKLRELQCHEDNNAVPDLVAAGVQCVEMKEWKVLSFRVSEAMFAMRMDFLSNGDQGDGKGVQQKIRLNSVYEDCFGEELLANDLSDAENDVQVVLPPEEPKQPQDVNNEESATGTTQTKYPGCERAEMSSRGAKIAQKNHRLLMEWRGSLKKQKAQKKPSTFLNEYGAPSRRTHEENPFGEGNRVPPGIQIVPPAVEVDTGSRMSIEDIKKIRAKYIKKGC